MVVQFKDGASWYHDFNEWLIECLEIITDRNEKYNLDTGPEMHHVRIQDERFYILTSKNDVNGNIAFRVVTERETPENRHDPTRRVCWGSLEGTSGVSPSLKTIFIRIASGFRAISSPNLRRSPSETSSEEL